MGLDGPDLVQEREFAGGVVAVVAGGLADFGPVLLLDVGLVVLVVGSAAGEGDVPVGAPGAEVVVDELAAVVRVDSEDREREP